METRVKISLCLPYAKKEVDRQVLVEWCRAADAGPFESLSCGERINGPAADMRVLLAAAAVLTERVRIVPSLYVLPMHSTVRAAKEIATLDVLAEGRVTLTVGVGGRPKDYRAVGASFEHRHQRMDDQVAEMKRLWAGVPPFDGADPIGPTPVQVGGPPILIGAMGPKAIARGARWADGIYAFSLNGMQSEMERMLTTARAAWKDAGRAEAPYQAGGFWYSLADDAETKLREYVVDYLEIAGREEAESVAKTMTRNTPEAVREGLENMRAAGCEECYMVAATHEISEIERLIPLLEGLD
jgi:alkanesulfonate monooxygenase SsuD/methylene tetrahydromethanopterin reductase-like flavin-dependent oxidoreductase (luciferase family)